VKAALVAVVAVLTLGCGSATGGTTSGLRGLVMRGPVTPVCHVGTPCDAPAPGVKLLFSRSGKVVARATTNSKGWYRVTLKSGRYSVRTNRGGFEGRTQPSRATVPGGRVARRDFFIDTGIR
jgi:carboxypeptidase family protein